VCFLIMANSSEYPFLSTYQTGSIPYRGKLVGHRLLI
jgi:hypothetical protein